MYDQNMKSIMVKMDDERKQNVESDLLIHNQAKTQELLDNATDKIEELTKQLDFYQNEQRFESVQQTKLLNNEKEKVHKLLTELSLLSKEEGGTGKRFNNNSIAQQNIQEIQRWCDGVMNYRFDTNRYVKKRINNFLRCI